MRIGQTLAVALFAFAAALIVTASPAAAQTTALYLQSDPGDYVGAGAPPQTLTPPAVTITSTTAPFSAVDISVSGPGNSWSLRFSTRQDGGSMVTGFYESAHDTDNGSPKLRVSGNGRGCSNVSGRFWVRDVSYNFDYTVRTLAVDFEQHCGGVDAALIGAIRINSSVPLSPFDGVRDISLNVSTPSHGIVTASGIACGSGSLDCAESYGVASTVALSATPDPGYQFLAWTGDCAGGANPLSARVNRRLSCGAWFAAIPGSGNPDVALTGQTVVFLDGMAGASPFAGQRAIFISGAGSQSSVTATTNLVQFWVTEALGSAFTSLQFKAPNGASLTPGTYEFATRYPFQAPFMPGLNVSVRNSGCNELRGRFVVHDIAFSGSTLVRFSADFEQHCNGAGSALFGSVRFNTTHSSLVPFDGVYPIYRLDVSAERGGKIVATGLDCGSDCAEVFAIPTSNFSITAVPDPGFVFAGWTNDCTGPATTTVNVDQRRRCTAVFSPDAATIVAPLDTNTLLFDSQAGDYIGQGQRAMWTGRSSAFEVQAATARAVTINVTGPEGDTWRIALAAPAGESLTAGHAYEYAVRSSYQGIRPALDISGYGRGCNSVVGRFVVHEIAFGVGGSLTNLSVDFEQHCSGAGPALFGSLRFNASRTSLLPFDGAYPVYRLDVTAERGGRIVGTGVDCGVDCDEILADPAIVALTAVPDSGFEFAGWADDCTGSASTTVNVDQRRRCTAVFSPLPATVVSPLDTSTILLISQAGDSVGRGTRQLRIGRTSNIQVTYAGTRYVSVRATGAGGDGDWSFDLAAPLGESLTAGRSYDYATRYPFNDSLMPSMAINGGCNELRGRFVIHEIVFAPNGIVSSLSADFEQHCNGVTPALFGSVRYNAARTSLLPFDGDYPVYRLQVTAERGGKVTATGIDCGVDCEERYADPTVVPVTAVPDSGFTFVGWTDDCVGSATTTVNVDQARRCTAVFNPAPGTVAAPLNTDSLLFDSEPGDWVGAGQRSVWTGRSNRFTVTWAYPHLIRLSVATFDGSSWFFELSAPSGQTFVAGRSYELATTQLSTSAPGLSVGGHGRGCTGTGRFIVHEIAFTGGGALDALAVDFEQHCAGYVPGLRGSLRYRSSRADLVPYPNESRSTLLFRHATSGETIAWVMTGTSRVATRSPSPSRVGTNWRFAGMGDLNANAIADWVWQEETTGELFVWFMDASGFGRTSYSYLSIRGPRDPLWKVVTLADMNGDGKPDLIFQHATTAALAVWYLDGTTVTGQVSMAQVADPNWRVVGAGDFNRDGKPDLLWRHSVYGYLIVWTLDGIIRTGVEWLNPSQLKDPAWEVTATRDLNADGRVDIIFQHPDGRMVAWFMDGVTRIGAQMLTPDHVNDPNWKIIGPR